MNVCRAFALFQTLNTIEYSQSKCMSTLLSRPAFSNIALPVQRTLSDIMSPGSAIWSVIRWGERREDQARETTEWLILNDSKRHP